MIQGVSAVTGNAIARVVSAHLDRIDVALGQIVRAGDAIGTVGNTGWGDLFGQINSVHLHNEYLEEPSGSDGPYFYDQDDPTNALDPRLLPRADVSNNLSSVVITEEDDPNAVASWKFVVTIARRDQDFDANKFVFDNGAATRTINYNTRAGLDPADNDEPSYNGIYRDSQPFNEASAAWAIHFYAHKSVFTTQPTLTIYDTQDNEIVSVDASTQPAGHSLALGLGLGL